MENAAFGKRLKEARMKKKLTQNSLTAYLGDTKS